MKTLGQSVAETCIYWLRIQRMYVRERTDCAGYASDAARSDYAFQEFGWTICARILPCSRNAWLPVRAALIVAMCTFGTYSSTAVAADVKVTLAGDQEVPPVKSAGSGSGSITVGADKPVSGSVTTGISWYRRTRPRSGSRQERWR